MEPPNKPLPSRIVIEQPSKQPPGLIAMEPPHYLIAMKTSPKPLPEPRVIKLIADHIIMDSQKDNAQKNTP